MRWRTGLIVVAVLLMASVPVVPVRAAAPGDPVGHVDAVSVRLASTLANYSYVIRGWAADPDAPGRPVELHLYRNGEFAGTASTGEPRPDVERVRPSAGPDSGWSIRVSDFYDPPGTPDRYCVYAINAGAGDNNTTLGCVTLPVSGTSTDDPVGHLDEVSVAPGGVRVRGWAGDPDAPGESLRLRVYYDDQPVTELRADRSRSDVARARPELGGSTGFDAVLPISPGRHRVCVYAGNRGPDGLANTTLGCATRTVPDRPPRGAHDPTGSFDELSGGGLEGTYRVRGWAFDPDSDEPATVHIRYLARRTFPGEFVAPGGANVATGDPRPDVDRAFPEAGPRTGWSTDLGLGKYGAFTVVCAYAQGDGPGADTRFIGCQD